MMDLDNVVSRELSETELKGIVGGMGRAKARREAKSKKNTSTTRATTGMTTRTTPVVMSTPMMTTK